jgi:hypothetical protein
MIQIVDLAAKFSAGMLRTTDGEILDQFDSRDLSPMAFAAVIARNALREDCELTLIEDVPFNKAYTQAMTKPVTRFQGIIIAMWFKTFDDVLWVTPSTWMSMFPGVQTVPKEIGRSMTKGQKDAWRIEAARKHAEERGYTPPDLVSEYRLTVPAGKRPLRKFEIPLEKNMTDYVSAFLMSEWALSVWREQGRSGFDNISGVSLGTV